MTGFIKQMTGFYEYIKGIYRTMTGFLKTMTGFYEYTKGIYRTMTGFLKYMTGFYRYTKGIYRTMTGFLKYMTGFYRYTKGIYRTMTGSPDIGRHYSDLRLSKNLTFHTVPAAVRHITQTARAGHNRSLREEPSSPSRSHETTMTLDPDKIFKGRPTNSYPKLGKMTTKVCIKSLLNNPCHTR
jgi:hypothetical protein